MSFFKALGKYIEESGVPFILTESLVLAEGSLKGFLCGTHYNRCKRIHIIFSAALQLLHFRQFLQTKDFDCEIIREELKKFQGDDLSSFPALKALLSDYDTYCEDTQIGNHSATAKFWMTYINFVKLYQEFSRSIRTNDINLFIFCLLRIASLMFAMNHQNYCRWIIKYCANLVNIDTTHPGLKPILENGGFSIKRTTKNFSRTSIDLTLEQTINADAANKLKGISNFTNSISARKRWALSHSIRTSLISHMLDILNINKTEDTSNACRSHVVKKDNLALKSVINEVENNINPFNSEIDKDNLFNISTGKSATEKVKHYLLNIGSIGDDRRNNFIQECSLDSQRFEATIKRQEIFTFASENKAKLKKENGKVIEVRFERNLVSRILALSLQNKIDLATILSFPLTPFPLSLCHIDGSINKTDKSSLFKALEKAVTSTLPSHINCTLIDGFYLLHLLGETPPTFGKLATQVLRKICQHKGNEIHIVFDKLVRPSIKDIERDKRANLYERSTQFLIQGSEQQRPSDFMKAMRNDNFKQSLIKFLCDFWQNDMFVEIVSNKTIYANCNDDCYKFTVVEGHMQINIVDTFKCFHEEADSRIIYHLSKIEENTNVVVRGADTDILIILLGNLHKINKNVNIWMEVGVASKNTCRFVDVNAIFNKLGSSMCKSLPAFHSLTGCDYTASFSRKGKLKPLGILKKDQKLQEVFGTFGYNASLSKEQIESVERFICAMYGKPNLSNINDARFDIFYDHCNPKPNQSPFKNLKNFDSAMIPPCKNVLLLKVKRMNQICSIWNNATQNEPTFYDPLENGWSFNNNKFSPIWFDGPQAPACLNDIILPDTDENIDIEIEEIMHNSSDDEQ